MRISGIVSLAALLALSACVADGTAPVREAEAAAGAVGAPVSCIDPRFVSSRRPAGPRALLFEMAGGTVYRNDLPEACPGLDNAPNFKIIQLEVTGSQVCRGDSFRSYDPGEAKAVGAQAFPRCRLGAFTPIRETAGSR